MARANREVPAGVIQHLMWHGIREPGLLLDEKDFRYFLAQMTKLSRCFNITLYAYCLLHTHVHMLAEPADDKLPVFMQRLGHSYATRFNWRYSTRGHVFSERYLPIAVTNDDYLITVSRYIHLNPREAGIVTRPEDYAWSSCRDYLGFRSKALIDTDSVLDHFRSGSQSRNHAIRAYREYLDEHVEGNGLPPIRRAGGVWVYDADALSPVDTGQVDESSKTAGNVAIDLVIHMVDKKWLLLPPSVTHRPGFSLDQRNAALWLARRLTGLTWAELSDRFRTHEVTARIACKRFEKSLAEHARLRELLFDLEQDILNASETA